MPIETVNITITFIASDKIVGAFTLPCCWDNIMSRDERELEEMARVGAAFEAKTGLRARFATYDWTRETATFYV